MFNYLLAALLQLSMFLLVEAAPVSVQSAKPWQAGTGMAAWEARAEINR